ncbi:type IV pilus assembly protein PilA [Paenibacillus sp. DS2015]|uniref:prepilin-type N-terminal cleavage/methylation domain-containing protein n=1 Tax=Paenibacillus sp. DS2015 TaxID=3373917 RepID=UPI003D2251BC
MEASVMSKVFKKVKKDEKGFTLIELLAVIVILAIIAIIAIPMIGNIINKSKNDSDLATARQIYDAARIYVIGEKNGDFKDGTTGRTVTIVNASPATTDDTLTAKGYLDKTIYLPSTKEAITEGSVIFDATGALDKVTLVTATHTTGLEFDADEVLKQEKTTTTTTTPPAD